MRFSKNDGMLLEDFTTATHTKNILQWKDLEVLTVLNGKFRNITLILFQMKYSYKQSGQHMSIDLSRALKACSCKMRRLSMQLLPPTLACL